MAITAADITKLRTATGAGMMDCKNALEEAGGDQDKAAELLRKKGIVKAAKRADKVAADGRVVGLVNSTETAGALVEVNSETDFVAKSEDFIAFSKEVGAIVLDSNPKDLDALNGQKMSHGKTVSETIGELTLKVGEKISIRRFARFEGGKVFVYLHGPKIGSLVELDGGDATVGVDVAMHIAAANPRYLTRSEVPAEVVEKEKEVYAEQLKGKPANIMENILKGKVDKFYGEITLLEQPFIKDEDKKVEEFAKAGGATIKRFARFELGEGIEKVKADFAAEVAEQLK